MANKNTRTTAKKISLDELARKLSDSRLPEKDLRQYFEYDAEQSRPFSPRFKISSKTVALPPSGELEARGATVLNSLNWWCRMRRRAAFEAKVAGDYAGPIIVSEGDSWFQYPIVLDDVVDCLMGDYAIRSLDAAGDELRNMLSESEFIDEIRETRASVLLFSGGGNDLLGEGRLERHLRDFDPRLSPKEYLKPSFEDAVKDALTHYDKLFRTMESDFPSVLTLCHGYDYAIPADGSWLGKPMRGHGITSASLQKEIVAVMIDRFNEGLSSLAANFKSARFVDVRGVVRTRWHDELHPNDAGFADVAAKFRHEIQRPREAPRLDLAPRGRGFRVARPSATGRRGISLHVGLNSVDEGHYQGWKGELAACENDALDLLEIATESGFETGELLTQKATRAALKEKVERAAAELRAGDIFLLTYSGHGSQVPDLNKDEPDNWDETWCLFDGQLIDDELYVLWSKFRDDVRVLVISDSCHSGTAIRRMGSVEDGVRGAVDAEMVRFMPKVVSARTYRHNRAFYEEVSRQVGDSLSVVDEGLLIKELSAPLRCSVKLISGCQDNQFSYERGFNGEFTARLMEVWDHGRFSGNYGLFHRLIASGMPSRQTPNHWNVGKPDPLFDNQRPFSI